MNRQVLVQPQDVVLKLGRDSAPSLKKHGIDEDVLMLPGCSQTFPISYQSVFTGSACSVVQLCLVGHVAC